MTKNSAKTNLLFENFTMDAAFDLDLAYPSEEDFTFVKKAKAEYTNKGYNTEAQYRPDVLAIVMTNKNRIIRVLVASILLGWNDMVQAMKSAFERLGGSNNELKGIINEIIANRSRISGFSTDEEDKQPEETQAQTGGLNVTIDSKNSPVSFRRIIAGDTRYNPPARRHFIVGKKDPVSNKYLIVIRGSDVGPMYEYNYGDTVFFESDTQALNFLTKINNINTKMPLNNFNYKITSKGINIGSTQINDLSNCVLVETICGPAYIYKQARNCVESLQEKIVHLSNGDWQVQSEKGRNMGTYDTKKEAQKRLGQVEYFKHMNEEVSKDLEDKIRSVIGHKETDDWHDGKAYLFEISNESKNSNNGDIDPFWIEKFDDDEVDFSKLKVYDRTPEEKEDGKYIATFMISGGKNGSGEWTDYLSQLADAFKALKEKTGTEPLLYKIDTDITDDVWTGYVFLYDHDDNVKESLNEDLIVIEPFEAKEKIEEIKKQIEEAKDWRVRKNLLTLMNIYLFQTLYESDHKEETDCNIDKEDWENYSDWAKEQAEELYDEHPELEAEDKEREAKIEASVEDNGSADEAEEKIEEDVEKHDHLNPKLFDNNHLKPEVREKCLEIVDLFLKLLEEDEVKIDIKDIIFTGSNASYNYTKDSDIDLHIIADTSNFECPDNLYPKLYNAYKSLFNSKYDISFYGIPVEIYVETGDTPLISNGIYSIKNDAWEQEPTETTIPEIDWNEFMKAYQPWEDEYRELIHNIDPETATDDKPIDDFITKVYELRHQGLANEGQYGFSNLIFKELRNRGHLQELKDLKNEIIENRLTLEALTEAANIDEKTRLIYRNKLAQIAHNQPIIQNNGLFQIFNVKADEVDYIIRELQRLDLVEFVSKTASKYDFSKINFDGMPSRYYTISGKIKL